MSPVTSPAGVGAAATRPDGLPRRRPSRRGMAAGVAALALFVLVALIVLRPALASTETTGTRLILASSTPAPEAYQRLVDRALVPTPDEDVVIEFRGCPGAESRSCVADGVPLIYIAPGQENARLVYHELGHVFDQQMPDWVRERFQTLIRDDRSWRSGRNSAEEQFAEAYSLCAIDGRTPLHDGVVGYGYRPSVREHRRACRLIRQANRRA